VRCGLGTLGITTFPVGDEFDVVVGKVAYVLVLFDGTLYFELQV
jgi:hypothetical protein